MKNDIVIVGAARTPVGAFGGALSSLPAHDLGKVAIIEALKRAGVAGEFFHCPKQTLAPAREQVQDRGLRALVTALSQTRHSLPARLAERTTKEA